MKVVVTVLISIFCTVATALASTEEASQLVVESYIHRAQQKQLYAHPLWLNLLHYKKKWLGGIKSEVEPGPFFLSSNGRTSPKEELVANIRGLLAPFVGDEKLHPQCRFMARRNFIYEALEIDKEKFPYLPCHFKADWKKKLDAEAISIVFASAYTNNPSSMFGHTFLKFHSKGNIEQRDLLNYGINFSANAPSAGGFTWAFKGLFGLFDGYFSMLPYHQKLLEYENIEGRDIWEYRLMLSRDEVERVVDHILELDGVSFRYWFFDKNCSYQILVLLDVARPELNLSNGYFYQVIPADTIRQMSKVDGLIAEQHFRPSLMSKLLFHSRDMSVDEKQWSKKIAVGEEPEEYTKITVDRKVKVLDAALDYSSVLYFKNNTVGQKIAYDLKVKRAKLGVVTEPDPVPTRMQDAPEAGHESARIGFGAGVFAKRKTYESFQLIPAYHDLISNENGYLHDSQIQLLKTEFRYVNEDKTFELNNLRIADVLSTSIVNTYSNSLSWKVDGGLDTILDADNGNQRAYNLNFGLGTTTSIGRGTLLLFNNLHAEYSEYFADYFRFGIGLHLSYVFRISEKLRIWEVFEKRFYTNRNPVNPFIVHVQTAYDLDKNQELRLGFRRDNWGPGNVDHWSLTYLKYYD